MNHERQQHIKNEMLNYLEGRLEDFWSENDNVTTYNMWGEAVTDTISEDELAAVTERILQAAQQRLFLALLNEASLDQESLERFIEPWMKQAAAFLEEQTDALSAEL